MSTNFLQTERFVQLKNYQTEVFFVKPELVGRDLYKKFDVRFCFVTWTDIFTDNFWHYKLGAVSPVLRKNNNIIRNTRLIFIAISQVVRVLPSSCVL